MGKNHHYVPQFYLKLFSNNCKSIGTWNPKTDKIIPHASIGDMASRDNLYGKDQCLEKMLATWESNWGVTIHKIIETNKIEAWDDFASILTFITIGSSRTLKSADESNYVGDYLAKLMLTNKISKDELDKITFEFDIPNLELMKIATEMTGILTDLQYVVIENNSSMAFITSDNPICCYNKFYVQRGYKRDYGWGTAGLIILLPLSPRKCLCFYDPMVYRIIPNNLVVLDSCNDIIHINRLLTRNAYHSIFFNNQENNCIDNIKSAYQKIDIEQSIVSLGPLLKVGGKSILDRFNLNFLKVRKKYKKIPLPMHMGGLMRAISEQYRRENRDKF